MINLKMGGIIAAAFIAGAFIASPELRVYAANTVGSSDIIDGSIQSVDIGNGQVKVADIGADAVGGSELIGVTKILFGQCKADSTEGTFVVGPGGDVDILCSISGVDADDSAIAMRNSGNGCFEVYETRLESNLVRVAIRNECSTNATVGTGADFSIIVFDK
jgi:hypothetical protein